MAKAIEVYTGILVDETACFSLKEICELSGLRTDWVIELVEYGILSPHGKTAVTWQFSHRELHALQRAWRLQQDLNINLSGIAMALELLEEIDNLRIRLKKLEQDYDKLL